MNTSLRLNSSHSGQVHHPSEEIVALMKIHAEIMGICGEKKESAVNSAPSVAVVEDYTWRKMKLFCGSFGKAWQKGSARGNNWERSRF